MNRSIGKKQKEQPSKPVLRWAVIGLAVLGVLVLTAYGLSLLATGTSTMTVTYRGVPFRVDRENPSFNPDQVAAIEKLALEIEAPAEFIAYRDMCDFHDTVEVPGSGSSSGGFGTMTEAGQFTHISWQIPTKARHRVLVYRRAGEDSPLRLFDDFIWGRRYPPLLTYGLEDGEVVYRNQTDGRPVRTRPLEAN